MKTISFGVRELQSHIGDALRAVKTGDRVVITSRGTPVAVLSKAGEKIPQQSRYERKRLQLAAEGKLILGRGGAIRPFRAPDLGGLSEQVLRDRR